MGLHLFLFFPNFLLAGLGDMSFTMVCRNGCIKGLRTISRCERRERVKKLEGGSRGKCSQANVVGRKEDRVDSSGGSNPWRYPPKGQKGPRTRAKKSAGIKKLPCNGNSLLDGGWRTVLRMNNYCNISLLPLNLIPCVGTRRLIRNANMNIPHPRTNTSPNLA